MWYAPSRMAMLLFLLCASGCATVRHAPVPANEDDKATGIRYYHSAPYLLVYADGAGGYRWQILQLPDQRTVMEARPDAFWASLEIEDMKFTNGVYTSSKATGDATAVPKAIIEAVEKAVIQALPALSADDKRRPGAPVPHLYRIDANGQEIQFSGGSTAGIAEINVPIAETPSEGKAAKTSEEEK